MHEHDDPAASRMAGRSSESPDPEPSDSNAEAFHAGETPVHPSPDGSSATSRVNRRVDRARRIWPTITVALLVTPVTLVISGIYTLILFVAEVGFADIGSPNAFEDWLNDVLAERPYGLLLLLAPGQVIFGLAALLPAIRSREPVHQRLGLVRGRLSWRWYIAFAIASPFVGLVSIPILSLFPDESTGGIEQLSGAIAAPSGFAAIVTILVLSVIPGFIEETLFRGYILRGLMRKWPAVFAIEASAVLFAVAHVDPVHATAVLPLGLWAAIIAWRTGSVWPCVFCHMFNNAYGVTILQFADPEQVTTSLEFDLQTILFILIGGSAFLLSCYALVSTRRPGVLNEGESVASVEPQSLPAPPA